MNAFVTSPWIAVVAPMLLALLLGVSGSRLRSAAPWIALMAPLVTVALGAASLVRICGQGLVVDAERHATAAQGSIPWFRLGGTSIELAWTVDGLAAVMLVVVGLVAACVIVFSIGYMAGERGWVRYFALLALFTGSMNLLVIAASFTTLFMGWELVGACSYLLIGFWYTKPSAVSAAVKAFITTRVGDVGLLLGIAILWTATGADSYADVIAALGAVPATTVAAAGVCLAIGAMGKSAQFPLHAWLPDAMEGPTPVSALIHAATMVAAGVYLVVRVWPIFEAAPAARLLLLAAGVISAFGAALAGAAQRDIKKVLAYSTISQLGLMFAALGVGAWYAAFFHLVTHAGFKALLFLTSGSVIHGTGTQDMHEMGGLRRQMPWTFAAWLFGMLALTGTPGFAGFFSKDLILEQVLRSSLWLGLILYGASALTAFYAARSTRLVFFGKPAEGLRAHESTPSMLLPLVVLGSAAVGLGWLGHPLELLLGHEAEPFALAASAAAVAVALFGAVIGWFSSDGPEGDRATAESLGATWRLLEGAYRWDALVDRVIVRPSIAVSRTVWAVADRLLADGAAEGTARGARRVGRSLSSLQLGDAQAYTLAIVVAAVLMLVVTTWMGR